VGVNAATWEDRTQQIVGLQKCPFVRDLTHFSTTVTLVLPKMVCRTEASELAQAHCEQLRGKWALVTGATSGIGLATATALVAAGTNVICCARNVQAGAKIAAQLRATAGPTQGQVRLEQLDLASLDSIRRLSQTLQRTLTRIDMLVLNGGVMATPPSVTTNGFEMQMGTNFVGHQALTQALLPLIHDQGRIVVLSSVSHRWARVSPEDLFLDERKYNGWVQYAKSKMACLLLAKEMARRLKENGSSIRVAAVHPGIIFTNLTRHRSRSCGTGLVHCLLSPMSKTPEQGAATTLYALTSVDYESGAYLEDCKVGKPASASNDAAMAKTLFEACEQEIAKVFAKGGSRAPDEVPANPETTQKTPDSKVCEGPAIDMTATATAAV
jgi:NAD(P)-dependent dehydrogenase (short-subunit alcohol dehydrogenase family)